MSKIQKMVAELSNVGCDEYDVHCFIAENQFDFVYHNVSEQKLTENASRVYGCITKLKIKLNRREMLKIQRRLNFG